MEAEHASLSCIIIDACGDPIAQVAYRCALCRKICDSTTDAMIHYQVEHVDLLAFHVQQQQQAHQLLQRHQAQNQQHGSARPSSSGSLLKRQAPSSSTSGSLLKKAATGSTSTSSSILKRASNAMRASQQQTPSSSHRSSSRRIASVNLVGSTPAAKDELDSIHRPYTTTSASRAARRYYSALEQREKRQSQASPQTSRSSVRNSTPRHLDRSNQYAANLKAKISAQKSASPRKETQDTGKRNEASPTPATSSQKSSQASEESPHSQDSQNLTNTSSTATVSSAKSSESTTATVSPSCTSTQESSSTGSTPNQPATTKDSSKSYSLRPRSSGKKRPIDL